MFTTFIDRKPVKVRRLFCAGDGCGQQGEIMDRTPDGLAPALIERRFKNKGWEVGASEKHDYCPACVEARRIERRQRRNRNAISVLENVKNVFPLTPRETPPQLQGGMEVQATAESPREMSRAERRIIQTKLEDVYQDEDRGYKPGWSDAAVARDLNVPIGWVAEERDRSFGPAKDNEEVRDMLDRVATKAAEAHALIDEVKRFRTELADVTKRGNDLLAKAVDIGKDLHGLIATADRIRKVVS
jgi:hypothetical protein